MRQCWGLTRSFRRCGRHGTWWLFCGDHRFQPLAAISFVVFTVIAGSASIYSAWFQGMSFNPTSHLILLDARQDRTLSNRVQRFLARRVSLAAGLYGTGTILEKDNPAAVAIDFKFRNAGTATAFIWKVAIIVDDAKLDQRPIVTVRYRCRDGHLVFIGDNTGWGTADCALAVRSERLEGIFPTGALKLSGKIDGGASVPLGSLNVQDRRWFRRLRGTTMIGEIRVAGTCRDVNGTELPIDAPAHLIHEPGFGGDADLVVSKSGFAVQPSHLNYDIELSAPTVAAILDPSAAPNSTAYPLSRRIPPGDVERFFITVGTNRSAWFRLRMKFFVNESTVVESQPLEVYLALPRDQVPRFDDGDELDEMVYTKP